MQREDCGIYGCYGWLIWLNAGKPCIGPTVTERPLSAGPSPSSQGTASSAHWPALGKLPASAPKWRRP